MAPVTDSLHHSIPPDVRMLEVSARYWHSQCLFVAARLGVADALAPGPLDAAALAKRVGAHPAYLGRLLRALASIGIFQEEDAGRFALNADADILRSDHPRSMLNYVIMMGDDYMWGMWGHLQDAIQQGGHPFERVFGTNFFDYLRRHPEKERIFAAAMTNASAGTIPAIIDAYPFGELSTLVEIGGGNGHLICSVLRRFPNLKGRLLDLPGVVKNAQTQGHVTAPDIADRIAIEAGDMFAQVPQGADGYMLKTVIHDWDDDSSVRILTHCRQAMQPQSRVLLIEGVLKPANQPDHFKFMDLAMFVSSGGCERTRAQYASLFSMAGLRLNRVIPTASYLSILEAVAA